MFYRQRRIRRQHEQEFIITALRLLDARTDLILGILDGKPQVPEPAPKVESRPDIPEWARKPQQPEESPAPL